MRYINAAFSKQAALLSLLIGLLGALCALRIRADEQVLGWPDRLDRDLDMRFIAHAGGGVDGIIYTNSKEALEVSLNRNFKLVEFDLLETSDGKLAAAHDWSKYKSITGEARSDDSPLSLADFKSRKIFGKYTPITGDEISREFQERPDLFLVTDKIQNFELIKKTFPFEDRIFVEIYSVGAYFRAILSGLRRPVWASFVGRTTEWIEQIKITALRPKYVTVSAHNLLKHQHFFEKLSSSGVLIFVYTSNDRQFIADTLKSYRSIIYTDHWDFVANHCAAAACSTY
jgi:glycerophosphoryl diester phosphodiesterase